jgi:hypothetical protein
MASTAELDRLLHTTATTRERVRGLLAVGLHTSDIADAAGVSESAVRNWSSGQTEPRPHPEVILDDLRAAARVLIAGGIDPARAVRWLKSRNREPLHDQRPLDVLPVDPMRVLAAAHEEVLAHASASGEASLRLVPAAVPPDDD